jgi:endonuclease/exonuclease/phosphatase family metal-dependent hydrolase
MKFTSLIRTYRKVKLWKRVILLFALFSYGSISFADDGRDDETISVMTQNLFMGTDFPELTAARNFDEFIQAVTITYRNILATKPKQRMAAIAQEIAKLKPDLIGLQEASILRTGLTTFPTTPSIHVEVDMLKILLAELEKLKMPYKPVAILSSLDAQAPGIEGFDVRFTVQDVLLVRTERLKKDFKLSDIVAKSFQTQLIVDTAIGPVTNVSGYVSAVIKYRNQKFRFVTTHLAVPFIAGVNVPFAQSSELVKFVSAANKTIPTVLVGDFNSSANDPLDPTFATYSNLLGAGFNDSWLAIHFDELGYSCCQAPDIKNVEGVQEA